MYIRKCPSQFTIFVFVSGETSTSWGRRSVPEWLAHLHQGKVICSLCSNSNRKTGSIYYSHDLCTYCRDLNTVRIRIVHIWKLVLSVSELWTVRVFFNVKSDHLVIFIWILNQIFGFGLALYLQTFTIQTAFYHLNTWQLFRSQMYWTSPVFYLVKTSLAVKCLKFRPWFIFMLVHRAGKLVRKLEGLVCYPDIMPSNQMATSVQYWALDFVYVRLWLIQ